MNWRNYIKIFKSKVDASNLTEIQVRDATDIQIKNFLSIDNFEFDRIRPYLTRIKNHTIRRVRENIENTIFVGIINKLTPTEKQWLKRQDSIELAERINPPDKI